MEAQRRRQFTDADAELPGFPVAALNPVAPLKTEGIKYAGSKRTLIPFILEAIAPLKIKTIFDGFSGSTRVSQAFSNQHYRVIANDIAPWSEVFAQCYLLNRKSAAYYLPIIEHLNSLPGQDGWFTQHYGGHPNAGSSIQNDGRKRVWQIHNTRKLDAIREEIDRLSLEPIERAVLITSLILAMDKVDSTVGHQASYLKDWAPRAYHPMRLVMPNIRPSREAHAVYRSDIFDLLPHAEADLAYYDPPYGSSNDKMPPSRVRYASYYHIWTSICLNDKPPVVGVANRRADVGDRDSSSVFEEFRRGPSGRFLVVDAIERLIRETKCPHILLSYSNQGRATKGELLSMIQRLGRECRIMEIDYRANVMQGMRWTHEWTDEARDSTKEFLFLLSR